MAARTYQDSPKGDVGSNSYKLLIDVWCLWDAVLAKLTKSLGHSGGRTEGKWITSGHCIFLRRTLGKRVKDEFAEMQDGVAAEGVAE